MESFRVLIADDDSASRALLAGILRGRGYEFLEAENGLQALDRLESPDAPRLAIIDWIMPGMEGPEVVRRVRSRETDRPPYIIILTAKCDESDIIRGLDAGANDYLVKPFSAGELIARLAAGSRALKMQDELVSSREELAYLASHDALTGLLNRRAIMEMLSKELARGRRHGSELVAAICDIDHFKKVNDTYGHQAGDDVLRAVSGVLRGNVREYDSVGRMGGEEFLLVLPLTENFDNTATCERIRGIIENTVINTSAGRVQITVSIGAFKARGREDGANSVVFFADKALYTAKEGGRNRVEFYCSSFHPDYSAAGARAPECGGI